MLSHILKQYKFTYCHTTNIKANSFFEKTIIGNKIIRNKLLILLKNKPHSPHTYSMRGFRQSVTAVREFTGPKIPNT